MHLINKLNYIRIIHLPLLFFIITYDIQGLRNYTIHPSGN